jgi:thiol-disulfide isomerase/thioredoxin
MIPALALSCVLSATLHAAPIELSVPTLAGETFDLAAQRGRWVVVNYWATWCGPCIKEMPELDQLDDAREDVIVLGLAFEETTPEDLERFLKKRPVRYPIAIADPYAPPAAFQVPRGLPTTHLINPEGELVQSFMGPVTRAELERVIAEATSP